MDDKENQQFNIEVVYHDLWNEETQKFEGHSVLYPNIIGYQMGSTAVAIMTNDNQTLIIPVEQFKLVRHFPA